MIFHTEASAGRAIDELARRQRGLVTTRQLRQLGLTVNQQEHRVARGDLTPIRRGVLRCAGVATDWTAMTMAAVLIGGPGAVASHSTAARLWGLSDERRPSGRPSIHITAPRRVAAKGITNHQVILTPSEMGRRNAVPVTSTFRTIADIAGDTSMTCDELGLMVDEALRRRLVRLADLRGALVRGGGQGRPSLANLRSVLAVRARGYEPGANDWERDMDQWWDAAGLPPAVKQHRTQVNGHRFVIDRAIVDLRIAVEWNGFAAHGQFRSGFDATTLRQLALLEGGWAYVPVTTRTPLDAVCRAVWTAVRARSRLNPGSRNPGGCGTP